MQTYNQDIYKLIVESSLEDITNQNLYLFTKETMMIALYSVGNVKRELKKIGRKVIYKRFC